MNFLPQGMVLQRSLGGTHVWTDAGGGVDSTQVSLGGVGEVGEMVHLGGTSWTFCHVPCFPPASSTLLLGPLCAGDRWQIGKALLLILCYLGTQEGSNPCTARVGDAGILWRGGSSRVSLVLCV